MASNPKDAPPLPLERLTATRTGVKDDTLIPGDQSTGTFIGRTYNVIKSIKISNVRQLAMARNIYSGRVVIAIIVKKNGINPEKWLKEKSFLDRNRERAPPPLYFTRTLTFFEDDEDVFTFLSYPSWPKCTLFGNTCAAPLSIQQVQQISAQIMRGLDFLHSQDLVHTNICPESVVFVSPGYVKGRYYDHQTECYEKHDLLTDTRIQIVFCGDTRDEGVMIGKDLYRSPEVVAGLPVTFKSDLFSLGCLIAEMTTDEPLFARVETSSELDYMRGCLVMMQHTLEPLSSKMVSNIYARHGNIFNADGLIPETDTFCGSVTTYLELYGSLEDIVTDSDAFDVVNGLLRMDPDNRIDISRLLNRYDFFISRIMF
ncbi:kinase-like domain-containing protein [Ephemerocybe angulata]|uniref:Kinase-like domain-containing protein n=1 Tax=Ephemerocybe angulata TaxID=980116 RepID=A0A8H6M3U5_9AGAR|nr:kinase-like domain-containing protein [Tulosesus angulatus]